MRREQLYIFIFCLGLFWSCNSVEPKETKIQSEVSNQSLFTLLHPDSCGIKFENKVIESESNNYFTNQYIYNGAGVAAGDVNNDGLVDLYFAGNSAPDELYLNKGDFRFEDISVQAEIIQSAGTWSTGVSFVDINGDGWQDIYVCRAGYGLEPASRSNLLYMNRGDGTFKELGRATGLNDSSNSTQALFLDYDKDGDLDIYVMNYPEKWNAQDAAEQPLSQSDHLYRNLGNGTFEDVTEAAGVNNYAFGLGIAAIDVNQDGWDDVYVANDYLENDFLYLNNQKGGFTEIIKHSTNHNAQSSMGMDVADINSDGYMDFFVAEMLPSDYKRSKVNMASMNPDAFWNFISEGKHYQYMHNVLQVNNGMGFFSDLSQLAGVDKTDWSWSPLFMDADNDGHVDLFVSNGIKRDMMHKDASLQRKKMLEQNQKSSLDDLYDLIPSTKLANYIFQNQGDFQFVNMADTWGLEQRTFSNGACYADLNNDGNLDLVINNLDQPASVYQNRGNANNWVEIKLTHPGTPNPNGIGSTVKVFAGSLNQTKDVRTVRGFQSGVSTLLHFGLSAEERIDSITVVWDNQMQQTIRETRINSLVEIQYQPDLKRAFPPKMVTWQRVDITTPFIHREMPFDDYEKEILLPHKQSTLGPMLSKGDVNGDGDEDFFIGGASGQAGQLFIWKGEKFTATPQPELEKDKGYEDLGSVFFDADGDGDLDLYVVSGSNEFGPDSPMLQDRLYLNNGHGKLSSTPIGTLPSIRSSGSRVVAVDLDQDGDEDLIVGGRAVPQRYPFPDKSFILINKGGVFQDQTKSWCSQLERIGIVTDLDVADLNADGKLDVVVVGEWMSPKIFLNIGDKLQESNSTELDAYKGWCYSCEIADWNGDGTLDILAGNIGLNHKFSASADSPFHLYAHDFDSSGTLDLVLAEENNGSTLPIRGKQCLSEQMPFLSSEKYNSYEAFSNDDLIAMFGTSLDSGLHLMAIHFSSSVFLQKDNFAFAEEKLPTALQYSAINTITSVPDTEVGVSSFLAAGNLYETEVETSRADAGTGVWFNSIGNVFLNSGFFVPGNVKDICLVNAGKKEFVMVANNQGSIQTFQKMP